MATPRKTSDDLFASGHLGSALWAALGAVFVLDLIFDLSRPVETVLWAGVLTVYGIACSVNARRCGRLHCYFTGPFFFVVAGLVLLLGFGVLDFGLNPGRWLIPMVILVFVTLRYLPERLWGRYRSPHQ